MLRGYAFMVRHPRRADQDFVTLDEAHVAEEASKCAHIGWAVEVSLIGFHGEGALDILTGLHRLLGRLDVQCGEAVFAVEGDKLVYRPGRRSPPERRGRGTR